MGPAQRISTPRLELRAYDPSLAAALALLAAAAPGTAWAEGFRKWPYLQNVSTTAITVMFETSGRTQAVVRYGPTREYGQAVRSGPSVLHEVRLEGLEPSTLYHYEVDTGSARSPDRRFTTAATADEPFRFLIYGDNRTDHDAHARVVHAMLSEDADLALNTGDMVHDGTDEGDWQVFFDVERRLLAETTMFPVIGNHEAIGAQGRALFRRLFALPEGS